LIVAQPAAAVTVIAKAKARAAFPNCFISLSPLVGCPGCRGITAPNEVDAPANR
jgi:hypothetical protein